MILCPEILATSITYWETKFFCMRKAETPQSRHKKLCRLQSRTTSSIMYNRSFQEELKRGVPSPKWLSCHGRYVRAVTAFRSACLIWKSRERTVIHTEATELGRGSTRSARMYVQLYWNPFPAPPPRSFVTLLDSPLWDFAALSLKLNKQLLLC